MAIITKEVKVKIHNFTANYYKSKGYEIPQHWDEHHKKWANNVGEYITVKVADLPSNSHEIITVQCDVCGKIYQIEYKLYLKNVKNQGYCSCLDCCRTKTKKTNIEKYGNVNPMQNKDIRIKAEQTNIEKYGCKNPMQNVDIRKKAEETNIKQYGYKNPMKSEVVKEKAKNTNIEKYGVPYVAQNPTVKEKLRKSLFENKTCATSSQQLYLHSVYGGKLNAPIKYYNADILLEDNIVIEYDGSGHNLQVAFGTITEEELIKKETKRFYVIRNAGYKQMRIVSKKDYLPSDDVLFQMLRYARQYFETSHSWITFNIDDSCIYNSVYPEKQGGLFYDFGKLRKIKKGKIA